MMESVSLVSLARAAFLGERSFAGGGMSGCNSRFDGRLRSGFKYIVA